MRLTKISLKPGVSQSDKSRIGNDSNRRSISIQLSNSNDYQKRLKRFGAVWGGVAMSAITFFILVKGAKGASFMTP